MCAQKRVAAPSGRVEKPGLSKKPGSASERYFTPQQNLKIFKLK